MVFDGIGDSKENADKRQIRATSLYESTQNKLDNNGLTKRIYNNTDMFSGIDGKQYGAETKRELDEKGIPATTINYCKQEVNTKTGLLLDNPVRTRFISRDSNPNSANILQDMFDYDFNRGKFADEISSCVRNGNIIYGIIKMIHDYTHDRQDGNIGIVNKLPKLIRYDQSWKSDNFRDCGHVFEDTYLSASQIKSSFDFSSQEIDDAIALFEQETDGEGLASRLDKYERGLNKVDGKYKVVELHYVEPKTIKSLVNKKTNEKTPFSEVTEEDLHRMYQNNRDMYYVDKEIVNVNKTFIFCPAFMNKVLYDGEYSLQLGRVPYFIYAYDIANGEVQGIVDQIGDLNKTINKRESAITGIITTSSNNNYTVEESTFRDPKDLKHFKKTLSTGGNAYVVSDGANSNNKIRIMDRGTLPNDIMKASDRNHEQIKSLANSTNVQAGKSEGAHESGILFSKKLRQTVSPDFSMHKNFRNLIYDISESYYYAFPQVYRGSERMFYLPDGRKLELNKLTLTPHGKLEIENDVDKLPRYTFTIDLDKAGVNKREENQIAITNNLKVITNPLLKTLLEKELVQYSDMADDVKKNAVLACDIFFKFQSGQMISQTKQFEFSNAQIDAQMQQLGGQQQQGFMGNEEPPQDAKQIASGAGMGPLPNEAGIAGRQGSSNNAPSDVVR